MSETKPYVIPKQLVWEAYQRVKANQGAAGVDGESLAMFEQDLKGNLYKVWNRMSSGSYFPPPVRLVEIPKDDGGMRPLGIPTVNSYCTSVGRILGCVARLNSARVAHPRSQLLLGGDVESNPVRHAPVQPTRVQEPAIDPVVHDVITHAKACGHLMDGQLLGRLQRRRWDVVAHADPLDHLRRIRLAGRTGLAVAVELVRDPRINDTRR
jgi:hypothetical protein